MQICGGDPDLVWFKTTEFIANQLRLSTEIGSSKQSAQRPSKREEMGRYFYEHKYAGKLAEREILELAKLEHPEWGIKFDVDNLRKMAAQYQRVSREDKIPSNRFGKER
jgi:hypothetical protein